MRYTVPGDTKFSRLVNSAWRKAQRAYAAGEIERLQDFSLVLRRVAEGEDGRLAQLKVTIEVEIVQEA